MKTEDKKYHFETMESYGPEDYCHYSGLPSPSAYENVDMDDIYLQTISSDNEDSDIQVQSPRVSDLKDAKHLKTVKRILNLPYPYPSSRAIYDLIQPSPKKEIFWDDFLNVKLLMDQHLRKVKEHADGKEYNHLVTLYENNFVFKLIEK